MAMLYSPCIKHHMGGKVLNRRIAHLTISHNPAFKVGGWPKSASSGPAGVFFFLTHTHDFLLFFYSHPWGRGSPIFILASHASLTPWGPALKAQNNNIPLLHNWAKENETFHTSPIYFFGPFIIHLFLCLLKFPVKRSGPSTILNFSGWVALGGIYETAVEWLWRMEKSSMSLGSRMNHSAAYHTYL